MATFPSTGLDEILFRALNLAGTNGVVDAAMLLITTLGAEYILVFVALPLWLRGRREATFDFLLLYVITALLTTAIKYAVDRPRPCDVLIDIHTLPGYGCNVERDPSFPSGHASRAVAVAAFIALRFDRRAGVAASAFAVLVGLSRVYLGVHWPSDVLAGALLGIGLALAVELANRRLPLYQRGRKWIVELIPHWPRRAA